jgi:hypothetical protein
VSTTDPQARIMRHRDGHYGLSYNVQITTDAAHGIAVGLHVGQAAPDYEYLVPAVAQIEERLAWTPGQMVVDAGYTSRQNILAVSEKAIELVGPWTEGDVPTGADAHALAQSRRPMDMMVQGWSTSLFQAPQQ